MGPDFFLVAVLVIAVAVVPVVVLGLVVSLRQRQENDHHALSLHLNRIERNVHQMQEVVQRLAKDEKQASPLEKQPPTPAPAPIRCRPLCRSRSLSSRKWFPSPRRL